jgi:hypothetical protein
MFSRRNFLSRMLAGAATSAVVGSELPAHAAVAGSPTPAGPSPWWLLAPLTAGAPVGLGWRVEAMTGVSQGAAVIALAHSDGRVSRVHVCAHDGAPRGVGHTALFDLILMDGGDGKRQTDEDIGRVVLGLASVIRTNELAQDADLRPLARLMTHPDRVATFGPDTLN